MKGHAEANIGIAEIANIIQDCLRTRRSNPDENDMIYPVENVDEDIAVRVGGDEFIIVLSNCNKENANIVVKRIKDRVEKEETKGLSIAIGLTDTNELKDISSRLTADNNYNLLQQLIKKAEANMYSDKIAANSNLPYQERVEILVDYILRGGKNIGLDIGDKALLDQMLKDALVIIQEMINEMGKEKALD